MDGGYKKVVLGQFEAALAMLNVCLVKCPDEHWDGPIAKYPFWQAAYHTLCFVDCYLSPSNEAFAELLKQRAATDGPASTLHPLGMAELEEEYPSRRFDRGELLGYVGLCRAKLKAVLGDEPGSETARSLDGPSGFGWLPFTRAELHLYNLRHVQHHAGQLGAYLRRAGVDVGGWARSGWK